MKHVPLVLSVAALVVAILAYTRSTPTPAGSGGIVLSIEGYDLSTPKEAFLRQLEFQEEGRLGPMLEMSRLTTSEFRTSVEVEDVVVIGEKAVLFIRAKEDGKPTRKTRGMKRLAEHDVWVPEYLSSYELREEHPDLAKRMRAWEEGDEPTKAVAPPTVR